MHALDRLAACAGRWRGSNRLHDPHTGKPEDIESTLVLATLLGGQFIRLEYTWSYQGGAQEGSLLIGYQSEHGKATAHWFDSWHMSEGVMVCEGTLKRTDPSPCEVATRRRPAGTGDRASCSGWPTATPSLHTVSTELIRRHIENHHLAEIVAH